MEYKRRLIYEMVPLCDSCQSRRQHKREHAFFTMKIVMKLVWVCVCGEIGKFKLNGISVPMLL